MCLASERVFVVRFTADNNVFFEFNPCYFVIKDHCSGKSFYIGRLVMVYIDSSPLTPYKADLTHEALIGERATLDT